MILHVEEMPNVTYLLLITGDTGQIVEQSNAHCYSLAVHHSTDVMQLYAENDTHILLIIGKEE